MVAIRHVNVIQVSSRQISRFRFVIATLFHFCVTNAPTTMTEQLGPRRRNRGSKTRRQREAAASAVVETDTARINVLAPPTPTEQEAIWDEMTATAAVCAAKRAHWASIAGTPAALPSAFAECTSAWLQQLDAGDTDRQRVLVDFGAGALVDTRLLARAVLDRQRRLGESWRVVAIEPYGPAYDPARLDNMPAIVSVCRRDFVAGTGACRQWWQTPVDIFYARNVFCSLDSPAERANVWALIAQMRARTLCVQVCRDDAINKKWLHAACRDYGYAVQIQGSDEASAWVVAQKVGAV